MLYVYVIIRYIGYSMEFFNIKFLSDFLRKEFSKCICDIDVISYFILFFK